MLNVGDWRVKGEPICEGLQWLLRYGRHIRDEGNTDSGVSSEVVNGEMGNKRDESKGVLMMRYGEWQSGGYRNTDGV